MKFFISYSTNDLEVAIKIASAFRREQHDVWMALDSIPPTGEYPDYITKAIENCQVFVLVFSLNAEESSHVADELTLARSEHKKILTLRIENIEPLKYKLQLGRPQRVDLFVNFDNNLKRVVSGYNAISSSAITSVHELAQKHFIGMGYKIDETDMKFKQLNQNTFVIKGHKTFTVIPIYINDERISYIKQLEGELFWKYRKLIWKENYLELIKNKYSLEDINEKKTDYKIKVKIVNDFRNIISNRDRNQYSTYGSVLFYLYWKNPPQYNGLKDYLPFEKEKNYSNEEKLSNVFLNLAFKPNWWGVEKNNFDDIPGKPYPDILKIYKSLLPFIKIKG